MRDIFQRFDVGGDILALAAVAARRAGDQLAVLIAQRHRQAVDLRLGGKDDFLVVGKAQKPADAADKIDDVLLRESVVEREHRHSVPHFGEARRGRRADTLRQAFARAQFWKASLDRLVALAQPVILGIGNGRRILLVIAPVVLGNFGRKPRVFGFGLFFREALRLQPRSFRDAS